MNVETIEFNHPNVEWLAGLKAQGRTEAELAEADERIAAIGGYGDAAHLRRRPDAQSTALCLQSMYERHVEAVQFDPGVKAVFEDLNNAGAQERLGTVQDNRNGHNKSHQQHQQSARNPSKPAVPAPE
jgi:hypothetical protein